MMKFAIIMVLLGCLPFIAYLAFNHSDSMIGITAKNPIVGTSVPETMPDGDYVIRLAPQTMPLLMGKQTLDLTLTRSDQKPAALTQPPAVTLSMQMDGHPMSELVSVNPGKTPGQYTLQTNFSMSGHWFMDVKPTPSSDVARFRLTAQRP